MAARLFLHFAEFRWEGLHSTPGRPGHGVARRRGRCPERGGDRLNRFASSIGKDCGDCSEAHSGGREQLWYTDEVDGSRPTSDAGICRNGLFPLIFRGDTTDLPITKVPSLVAPPGKTLPEMGKKVANVLLAGWCGDMCGCASEHDSESTILPPGRRIHKPRLVPKIATMRYP